MTFRHFLPLAMLLIAAPAAPAAPARLSPLAMSCLGCHAPAVDAESMPALHRLAPARIAERLRAARDDPAPGSIMARFAEYLSNAEIDALATELGKPPSR